MTVNAWTRDQLKLAFHLYCQLPFGRLHARNPEIIELAALIGRTPSAVAMKLVNLASLDPAITASGRSGLGNASRLDREVRDEFAADWDALALECEVLRQQLGAPQPSPGDAEPLPDYSGDTRQAVIEQRIGQRFFRRAVLGSYRERCCMSGLADPRLLIASHIVPWSRDRANRLNPGNGLCLSALHDRAFDQGLITLTDDFRVRLAGDLRRRPDAFAEQVLLPLEGRRIELPERFLPDVALLARHRAEVFIDGDA